MTIKPTCRIGKVTLKDGHYRPGRTITAIVRERGCGIVENAYFKRLSEMTWGRIPILEYVRMVR